MLRRIPVIDFLIILPVLIFASGIYLIPPFQTIGYHALFSDDAVFAILARKALEQGPSGAYHLAWGPLQPWLNALFNRFFNIPLDEGGRVITGIALTFRVIPTYILAKLLFGRLAAFITIFLITVYTFLIIPNEGPLTEGVYSLFVLMGFLFSYLALKKEKGIWYILSGISFGLSYLTRLEGWFFITPLLFLTSLKIIFDNGKQFTAVKFLLITIISFIITIFPYLSFVHKAFGSWTLNPRMNIVIAAPGNHYAPYKDDINGITTTAQIYYSGELKYYNSNLWHPNPSKFWRQLGRNWESSAIIPVLYFKLFKEQAPVLFFLGILGLFLTLYNLFRNKFSLLFAIIALGLLIFFLADFLLVSIEFLSPVIFNPEGNLQEAIKQFLRVGTSKDYKNWIFRDGTIIFSTIFFFIFKWKKIVQLSRYINLYRIKFYLPLSLLIGLIPLFFGGYATKYAVILGGITAFYAGYSIASCNNLLISKLLFKKLSKKFVIAPALLIITIQIMSLAIIFATNKTQIWNVLDIRTTQYKKQDFQFNLVKNPGLAILKDHGPNAKIASVYEAPVFYAQGRILYLMINVPLEQTLSYLEENLVDYLYMDRTQGLIHKELRPLLSTKTKLPNWKIIYSDPPFEKDDLNESDMNVSIAVWKRVD